MADLGRFDANQVEPSSDFEPIPAGKYLAVTPSSAIWKLRGKRLSGCPCTGDKG